MAQTARKLGILISVAPTHPNFHHGLQLATAALEVQDEVYLYCLDEADAGISFVLILKLLILFIIFRIVY